ncbi:uncharacterized protein BDW47DRAFT_134714 [Aspergillus candidus]|uniref:Deoxyribonuclease NucA/NucB domain-containing protein n=1 Tax=Aspergillus candidus TaxID=41067 RepID=A0A2I2EZR1_ASPCN|nr:hypothetical protein BDW47DRAFT_134714 [Aspergillus candidus]PLB33859.1 hypothetical protein BDW47DRAFT_134714 [Aspergillus candidus]
MRLNVFPVIAALLTLLCSVQAQDTTNGSASDYELVRANEMELTMGNDSISLDPFDDPLEKRQHGMSECPPSLQTTRGQLLQHGLLFLPGKEPLLPCRRDVFQLAEVLPEIMLPAERHLWRRWVLFDATMELFNEDPDEHQYPHELLDNHHDASTSTEPECTVEPTANVRRTWLGGLTDMFQGSEHQLEKRQRPFPKSCTTECHTSGQRLPVVEFTPVRGETDELVKSMCAGMNGWYKRQKSGIDGRHDIWTDLAKGEDVLTYGGPAKKNPDAADRRKDVQCKKFYKSECEALGKKRGVAMECDEYPPAMSLEGGGLATRMCVPAKQNSRTQGPQFRLFVKTCGLKRGDKFLVRLKGGCNRFNFPARREDATHTIGIADEDATFRDPNDDGSLTYVAVGLGDLEVGHYEIDAEFNGTVREAVILNQYGDEYASLDSPSESAKMSFDVTDDYYQPAALVAYTEHPVKVSYNGTVQASNKTGAPAPSETPSSAMALGRSIAYTLSTTLTLGILQQLL